LAVLDQFEQTWERWPLTFVVAPVDITETTFGTGHGEHLQQRQSRQSPAAIWWLSHYAMHFS